MVCRMNVILAGMKTTLICVTLIVYLRQGSWMARSIVNELWYFERNLFIWAVGINLGLKYSVNQAVNRHAFQASLFHLQRQSRFRIILNGPRIFRMEHSIVFNWKSPAALAPNKSHPVLWSCFFFNEQNNLFMCVWEQKINVYCCKHWCFLIVMQHYYGNR